MTRPLLAAALLLLLAACGEEEAPPASPWSSVTMDGVPDPSDLCVVDDELLFVSGGGSRDVYAIGRKQLEAGARLFARPVPVQALGDPFLGGTDELGARGYRLSDLWSQDVDLQALAYLPPDHLYLGERRYRVVYEGFVERDAMGRAQRVVIQRVAAVPGAVRAGRDRSDWRDVSPGISGISARGRDDLVVVERASRLPGEFHAIGLDKLGLALSQSTYVLPPGALAEVEGIAWSGDRGLVLNGPGSGALISVPKAAPGARTPVGPGDQGPVVEGTGPWRGVARADDGTTFLVSGAPSPRVVWR